MGVNQKVNVISVSNKGWVKSCNSVITVMNFFGAHEKRNKRGQVGAPAL